MKSPQAYPAQYHVLHSYLILCLISYKYTHTTLPVTSAQLMRPGIGVGWLFDIYRHEGCGSLGSCGSQCSPLHAQLSMVASLPIQSTLQHLCWFVIVVCSTLMHVGLIRRNYTHTTTVQVTMGTTKSGWKNHKGHTQRSHMLARGGHRVARVSRHHNS